MKKTLKKTLKRRLVVEHDTLRVLTDLPETKRLNAANDQQFPPASSGDPKQCIGTAQACSC